MLQSDLQGKKFCIKILRVLQNMHHLKPHIWIVLQLPQDLVCCHSLEDQTQVADRNIKTHTLLVNKIKRCTAQKNSATR